MVKRWTDRMAGVKYAPRPYEQSATVLERVEYFSHWFYTTHQKKGAALKDAIGDTLVTIIVLAHQLDLDVTECLGLAYEEIKNRKGKMINGTFVKEEDL